MAGNQIERAMRLVQEAERELRIRREALERLIRQVSKAWHRGEPLPLEPPSQE